MTPVSALLLVKDEKRRLPATLAGLGWADEVVVVDTGSADGTTELAREAGARVVGVPWEGYVASRNRALREVRNDWVLFVDADERVSPALRDEILAALARDGDRFAGYLMPRLSYLMGRPIRHGTWYPDRKLRLGRRSAGLRAEGGRVHEYLVVDGPVGRLASPLLHDEGRTVSEAVRRISSYARLAALDRRDRGARASGAALLLRPLVEFLRAYVLKRGFLDGRAGFATAALHSMSYVLRASYVIEADAERSASGEEDRP